MINLTSKELTLLSEQLGGEQLLVKRFRDAATNCTDPQFKQQFEQIADRHQQHYNTLQNFLK